MKNEEQHPYRCPPALKSLKYLAAALVLSLSLSAALPAHAVVPVPVSGLPNGPLYGLAGITADQILRLTLANVARSPEASCLAIVPGDPTHPMNPLFDDLSQAFPPTPVRYPFLTTFPSGPIHLHVTNAFIPVEPVSPPIQVKMGFQTADGVILQSTVITLMPGGPANNKCGHRAGARDRHIGRAGGCLVGPRNVLLSAYSSPRFVSL